MDTLTAAEVIASRSAETTVLARVASKIEQILVRIDLTYCEPAPNRAIRFDLAGPAAMGRLTWWSDGSAYVEVLGMSDEETLLSVHSVASTSAEASSALLSLAESVVELPSNNSFKPTPLRGAP